MPNPRVAEPNIDGLHVGVAFPSISRVFVFGHFVGGAGAWLPEVSAFELYFT